MQLSDEDRKELEAKLQEMQVQYDYLVNSYGEHHDVTQQYRTSIAGIKKQLADGGGDAA